MKLKINYFFLVFFLLVSCVNTNKSLKNGIWRGVLTNKNGIEIPFNFEVKRIKNVQKIILINGNERLTIGQFYINGDSVFIKIPLFDSEIKGVVNDKNINGVWIKHLATSNQTMQFTAMADANFRFKKQPNAPTSHLNGKWKTTFLSTNKQDTTHAIGEFKQIGNQVLGTFLTTTGDFRYLDGIVEGNKFSISTFDGAHAYLFTGNITNDSVITDGKFYSGLSGEDSFTATKNPNAQLPDAYSLTNLKQGVKKINFSYPNLDNKLVSLTDSVYKNKVVLVQILGSWCPNCMDETAFLAQFYKKNKSKGIEVIGLAYERTSDFEKSKTVLTQLKKRFNVQYPILITGFTKDKGQVLKSLPQMQQFVAFPTLLVIDKNGDVHKIHTGFTGPGTGQHYTNFIKEFDKTISYLCNK